MKFENYLFCLVGDFHSVLLSPACSSCPQKELRHKYLEKKCSWHNVEGKGCADCS